MLDTGVVEGSSQNAGGRNVCDRNRVIEGQHAKYNTQHAMLPKVPSRSLENTVVVDRKFQSGPSSTALETHPKIIWCGARCGW